MGIKDRGMFRMIYMFKELSTVSLLSHLFRGRLFLIKLIIKIIKIIKKSGLGHKTNSVAMEY